MSGHILRFLALVIGAPLGFVLLGAVLIAIGEWTDTHLGKPPLWLLLPVWTMFLSMLLVLAWEKTR